jgi:hypothetical protein
LQTDFVTALELGDRDGLRRAPKADLHIHGFGGGDEGVCPRKDRRRYGCTLSGEFLAEAGAMTAQELDVIRRRALE